MDWINNTLNKVNDLWDRSLDRHVRVAVTGLSGAGKTAFITSLINQLLFASSEYQLPFFEVVEEGRLKASKLELHSELHIPSFKYDQCIEQLTAEVPSWPESTKSISQAQIKCRFKVKNPWLKKVHEQSVLTVDIVDYPGEWLLDLPLLGMSFKDWSQQCLNYLQSERRKDYTKDVVRAISSLEFHKDFNNRDDDGYIAELAKQYKESLLQYRNTEGDNSIALPGRFILPGELTGAPVLDFFPIVNEDVLSLDWSSLEGSTLLKSLERKFDYYKREIIKPFFEDYFSKVDRQILLIDTTSVLESDYEAYQDLKKTIELLLTGFSYGRSNWLKRLFSPTIDKLMIATTKVDLIPPDQHSNIESFMQKMVAQAKNDVGYEGVEVETMAISSVSTSEPVTTEHNGQPMLCVKGLDNDTGEPVLHYPGKVPSTSLSRTEWQSLDIDFSTFGIPEIKADEPLPYIRMDKVLQFLLGDKFS
ncbi:YcjX family GTP-binding protein [Kangiella sediminilitoris]|uniref:Nucleoside triphosphate hydrolase domain protein n=1 Tax=Kangiella sediminilitoris TaxID=1144748 RepID=A0A1B3B9A2_9GAMM|nr:YcjX family protein [Kangiella sediminilitoris]AOE49361.1 Nucleoside triphosphate hydrolase domain protein [Kangiella sediminilitoris]